MNRRRHTDRTDSIHTEIRTTRRATQLSNVIPKFYALSDEKLKLRNSFRAKRVAAYVSPIPRTIESKKVTPIRKCELECQSSATKLADQPLVVKTKRDKATASLKQKNTRQTTELSKVKTSTLPGEIVNHQNDTHFKNVLSRSPLTSVNVGFNKSQSSLKTESMSGIPSIELIGRHTERCRVQTFIQTCIDKNKSGSLYVSGAPGTGKTAVVLREARRIKNCQLAVVNCMQLSSAGEVYARIAAELRTCKGSRCINNVAELESFLNRLPGKKPILLILDEVDQLSSKCQDVLYRIFDWPVTLSCCLVIIGIANALDLPERLLPRLQSKAHQPLHLAFPPYTRNELNEIVSARLGQLNYSCENQRSTLLDPLAVQLCARKISVSTGDVRRALDICRRAIDLARQEARTIDKSSTDHAVNPSAGLLRHVVLALKESQGSNLFLGGHLSSPTANTSINNGTATQESSSSDLPLHHKLVLAVCCLLRQQKHFSEFSFNQLFDGYTFLCKTRHINSLDECELAAVCGLLDSHGFINFALPRSAGPSLGTPARFRRIRLRLDDRSVRQLLADDDTMFSSVLKIILP